MIGADELDGCLYLIVSENKSRRGGKRLNVRMNERTPSLRPGEVAIRVDLSLPAAIFERPQLTASVKVPKDKITSRTVSADVMQNISDIVKQQTGLDLTIKIGSGK